MKILFPFKRIFFNYIPIIDKKVQKGSEISPGPGDFFYKVVLLIFKI